MRYLLSISEFNSFMYPAVIIPDGSAIMAIPKTAETIVTKRPIEVTG